MKFHIDVWLFSSV